MVLIINPKKRGCLKSQNTR